MIELTQAQQQALEAGAPIVPTNTTYLLIRKDVYERIKWMLGDEDWAQEAYDAAMEVFTRDGWDDPRMNVYDGLNPAPDELFTAAQQERLAELQIRWRAARDSGTQSPPHEQTELEALVEAELRAAGERSAAFVRQLFGT